MRQLKIYLIALLVTITFLFNIERLDVGTENLLNIQTFVYVLAIIISTSILMTQIFSRYRVTLSILFTLSIYAVGKLIFLGDQSLFNDIFIYVVITEVAFLSATAYTSQRLARTLYEFHEGFEALALDLGGTSLKSIPKAGADIRREFTRSRHYHRPLSLILVEPDENTINMVLPKIYEDLQQSILNRFARVQLASKMSRQLRLMDLILEDSEQGFVILCPEVDAESSIAITERIETVMNQSNVQVKCKSVTFPDDALTFEGLLEKAKSKDYPTKA